MELNTKASELIAQTKNIILEKQALREIRLRSQRKLPANPAGTSDSRSFRRRARER